MKAQSIRRLLWFGDLVLLLGLVAAAAYYFVKVKPAAAADADRGKWVKESAGEYAKDAANAKPTQEWKVREKDFEHIIRPDLMDRKRGPGVWAFIGPVPPKFEPLKETPTAVVEAPRGLAAMGRLVGGFIASPPTDPHNTIMFMFNEGKKNKREFSVGSDDPIEDKELKPGEVKPFEPKPRGPGKYLVALEIAGDKDGDLLVKVTYDEILGDKTERKEEVLTLDLNMEPGKVVIPMPATASSGPGATAAATPRAGPDPKWGPPQIAKVVMDTREIERNHHEVSFRDDQAYYHWGSANVDDLVNDVKSEDVKDDRGGGVRASGVKPGSVASQFGVEPGDILRSINGVPVHSRSEAVEVVKRLPKDTQRVTVVLTRKGEDHTYEVDARDPRVRAAAGKVTYRPGK